MSNQGEPHALEMGEIKARETGRFTRREWLMGTGCLGLSLVPGCAIERSSVGAISPDPYPRNAAEGLLRLKTGNQRFMEEKPIHTHENASWRHQLEEKQKPFATVLGCSDSRVPPEMIFDVGFGDIFTIRLAGNIVAEDVIGSLQYAAAHLRTPLFVVLGHEKCGAVTATVDELLGELEKREHIEALLALIKPGLSRLDLKLDRKTLIHTAVEANVRWSMQQLMNLPEAQRALREGSITLVGAVYELNTGRVRFLA